MSQATPNIFEYIDFRKYLTDFYKNRKRFDFAVQLIEVIIVKGQMIYGIMALCNNTVIITLALIFFTFLK